MACGWYRVLVEFQQASFDDRLTMATTDAACSFILGVASTCAMTNAALQQSGILMRLCNTL
jgi:hypothetical protein